MNTTIRAVVIEDELHSRSLLINLLEQDCSGVLVFGSAGDVHEAAVTLIKSTQPEVVFLDVELQTGTGFDVLRGVSEIEFDVIFTTAYKHYALDAIRWSSLDYLLKPIDLEELHHALDKARSHINEKHRYARLEALMHNLESVQKQRIGIPSMEDISFVNFDDIVCCVGRGAYTEFKLNNGSAILASKNLKEYESLLPHEQFMRVHKSYVINLSQVKRLVKSEGGYIEMSNSDQVLIAPGKKQEFLARMARIG